MQRKLNPVCSESEADAAKAMADKLMAKHNIGIRNGKLFSMPTSASDPKLNALRTRNEFHKNDFGKKESEAWRKERWKAYQERVVENNKKSAKLADGLGGDGSGWTDGSGGSGFLQAVYDKKRWPIRSKRQKILTDVLHGNINLPDG